MSGDRRLGLTRVRDLAAVGAVAAIAGHLLIRTAYGSLPPLPVLAGVPAALLGIAEGLFGWVLRRRLREDPAADPSRRPMPALTVARALMTAKASSLAGAAFAGLWLGVLVFLALRSSELVAAADDLAAAVVGVVGGLVLLGGALLLELSCRDPERER